MEAAEADAGTRCVVLTRTGDRAFCAGMDLRSFAAARRGRGPAAGPGGVRPLHAGDIEIPVVGAANATAVAGGFELLLGCDVVVASDQARFGLPEVKRAVRRGRGVFISTRIPLALALELTLTGDYIGAPRAQAIGLINQVVRPSRCWTRPSPWPSASRATAAGDPGGQEAGAPGRHRHREAWELHAELQPQVFNSDDAKEGATAFVEKRSPVWTGR